MPNDKAPLTFENSGMVDCVFRGRERVAEMIGPESAKLGPLFAAAPELLEALRETLEFAIEANNRLPPPESKEEMESGFGCNSWTVDVFKRARNAIAKATGE